MSRRRRGAADRRERQTRSFGSAQDDTGRRAPSICAVGDEILRLRSGWHLEVAATASLVTGKGSGGTPLYRHPCAGTEPSSTPPPRRSPLPATHRELDWGEGRSTRNHSRSSTQLLASRAPGDGQGVRAPRQRESCRSLSHHAFSTSRETRTGSLGRPFPLQSAEVRPHGRQHRPCVSSTTARRTRMPLWRKAGSPRRQLERSCVAMRQMQIYLFRQDARLSAKQRRNSGAAQRN